MSSGPDEEEVGDIDETGVGGDCADGWLTLLVWLVGGADDKDDGDDDGSEIYLDLWNRLFGDVGDMNDGVGGGDGEDDDFEGTMMNPVGDIGEIGEPDDADGILIKLAVVAVGDIGVESNSGGVAVGETSELTSRSVWEEFV